MAPSPRPSPLRNGRGRKTARPCACSCRPSSGQGRPRSIVRGLELTLDIKVFRLLTDLTGCLHLKIFFWGSIRFGWVRGLEWWNVGMTAPHPGPMASQARHQFDAHQETNTPRYVVPQEREDLRQSVSESPIGIFEREHRNRAFRVQCLAGPGDVRTPNCIVTARRWPDFSAPVSSCFP